MTTQTAPLEVRLWTREREVQLSGRALAPIGPDHLPVLCPVHRVPLASGKFCWDHRITDGLEGEWELGEDWFPCLRHADGTACYGPGGVPRTSCFTVSQCGDCGRSECVEVELLPYGDSTWCRECGAERYYSIGD
jgi:hypothetical protein